MSYSPCVECFIKYDKQFSPDCDCDYAKACASKEVSTTEINDIHITEMEAIERLKDHFAHHNDGRPTPYLDASEQLAYNALMNQCWLKGVLESTFSKNLSLSAMIEVLNDIYKVIILGCEDNNFKNKKSEKDIGKV